MLTDPVVLASLLLRRSGRSFMKMGIAKEVFNELISFSSSAKEDSIVYAKVDAGTSTIRLVLVKNVVVAMVLENATGVKGLGNEILGQVINLTNSDARIRVIANEIPISMVDQRFANRALECYKKALLGPLLMWRRRGLYGFVIEDIISDKGAFTYVMLTRGADGARYALKVFRDTTPDGKPVVLNSSEKVRELTRSYIDVLKLWSLSEEELRIVLAEHGYDPNYATKLRYYVRYLSIPRALVVLRELLDRATYVEAPPVVVEEYADMGDLEGYVKSKKLDLREVLYVMVRLCGALALAHLVGIVHLDVKPRNILLFSSNEEPYGYTPKITDFSGARRLDRGYELRKITPGFADPVALIMGYADPSYDVYSLALTAIFSLKGSFPSHRLAVNSVILTELYGYPLSLEFVLEDPELSTFVKNLETMCASLKAGRVNKSKVLEELDRLISKLDEKYIEELRSMPKLIVNVFRKALSLDRSKRYKNCFEMLLELISALQSEGFRDLIPS